MPAAPEVVACGDVREAAGPRDHFAERARAFPRHGERADAAAALAGDRPACRVVAQPHRFFHLGKNLFQQEPRVLIRQRVVLEAAIVPRRLRSARLDEHADGDGHVSLCDQIVEDSRRPGSRPVAVLKDHDGRGILRTILRRHVHPPVALRAVENPALPRRHLCDDALRHAGMLAAVGMRFPHFELRSAKAAIAGLVVPCVSRSMRKCSDKGIDPGRSDLHHRIAGVAGVASDPGSPRVGWRRLGELQRPGHAQFVYLRRCASQQCVPAAEGAPDTIGQTFSLGALGFGRQRAFQGFRVEGWARGGRLLGRAHGTAQQDSCKDGRRESHGSAPVSGDVI